MVVFFVGSLIGINSTSNYQADESYYIYSAMKMNQTGNWLTPYYEDNKARFQKPILFYWFVAGTYKFLGFGIWQARMVSLFISLINLFLIYYFCNLMFKDKKASILSVIILASNIMFLIYAKVSATDMTLFTFINLSLFFFYRGFEQNNKKKITYGYLFSGLAVATKGPVGVLIPLITIVIYAFYKERVQGLKRLISLYGFILFLCTSLFWPILMLLKFKSAFLNHFFTVEIKNRVAYSLKTQMKNFSYYIHTLLRYAHIWLVLFFIRLFNIKKLKEKDSSSQVILVIWIFTVLLLFSFFITMHRSRYILPLFFPLSMLMGYYLNDIKIKKAIIIGSFLFGLFLLANGILPALLKPEALKPLCQYIKKHDRKIIAVGVPQRSRVWIKLFAGQDAFHTINIPLNKDIMIKDKVYLIIQKELWDASSSLVKKRGKIIKQSSYMYRKKFKSRYLWQAITEGFKKSRVIKEVNDLIEKHKLTFYLVKMN